ncbi:hypothetical protein Bbelb_388110 [Branchiostoma belcheri]|nr:hypothetical protein Bbelb_388110 [Branchiostoma belcheri]
MVSTVRNPRSWQVRAVKRRQGITLYAGTGVLCRTVGYPSLHVWGLLERQEKPTPGVTGQKSLDGENWGKAGKPRRNMASVQIHAGQAGCRGGLPLSSLVTIPAELPGNSSVLRRRPVEIVPGAPAGGKCPARSCGNQKLWGRGGFWQLVFRSPVLKLQPPVGSF